MKKFLLQVIRIDQFSRAWPVQLHQIKNPQRKKVMDNKEELLIVYVVALKSSFSKLTTSSNELQEYALLVERH